MVLVQIDGAGAQTQPRRAIKRPGAPQQSRQRHQSADRAVGQGHGAGHITVRMAGEERHAEVHGGHGAGGRDGEAQ